MYLRNLSNILSQILLYNVFEYKSRIFDDKSANFQKFPKKIAENITFT